jgi:hypothetical protein
MHGKRSARRGEDVFPLERILSVIDLDGQGAGAIPQLLTLADADDAAVRYWAVVGLANHRDQTPATLAVLCKALKDSSVGAPRAGRNTGVNVQRSPGQR